MNPASRIVPTGLLVAGLAGTLGLGFHLRKEGALDVEPNLLWLKRSPYGRTIAYAMRGPADLYWHRGGTEDHGEIDEENLVPSGVAADPDLNPMENLFAHATELKREFDEHEAEEEAEEAQQPVDPSYEGPRDFVLTKLRNLKKAYYSRTNDTGDTALAFSYMKGEAQKRLRLSHEMDPTNLICYGSYFLFLSESIARVQGDEAEDEAIQEGRDEALELARSTVSVCLEHDDEPLAMITATSAAHDTVTLLLERKHADLAEVERYHQTSLRCLGRFEERVEEMVASGMWERFSPYRRQEMTEAHKLLALAVKADRFMIDRRRAELAGGLGPLRRP